MEDGSEEEDAGEENPGADRKGNGEPYEVSRVISGEDGDVPGINVVADDAGERTGGPRGPSTAELAVGNPGVTCGRPRPVSGNCAARAPDRLRQQPEVHPWLEGRREEGVHGRAGQ